MGTHVCQRCGIKYNIKGVGRLRGFRHPKTWALVQGLDLSYTDPDHTIIDMSTLVMICNVCSESYIDWITTGEGSLASKYRRILAKMRAKKGVDQ